MSPIGSIISYGLDKFLYDSLNALSAAGGLSQVIQSCKQGLEDKFVGSVESLANHLVDFFPDISAFEGYSFVAALDLEFEH